MFIFFNMHIKTYLKSRNFENLCTGLKWFFQHYKDYSSHLVKDNKTMLKN